MADDNCGILYIAFGDSFTKEGVMSYLSLRRHMTDVKVCFMTDRVDLLNSYLVSDVNLIVNKIQPRHIRSKVDFVSKTPFKKTLYLDSDTLIVRDLSDIFDSLDRFDVALTHDFARKRKKYADIIPEYNEIPYSFSEVNGGVFAYSMNERTEKFLQLWHHYFYKYFDKTNGWDQVSLRISLWQSEVKLFHLPVEFNIRSKAVREKQDRFKHEYGEQHMAPRIYHMHYDPEVHRGVYNIDSLEILEDRIKKMAIEY
jgi:hypothetical protein